MAVSEQFKRCVVAVFQRDNLRGGTPEAKAVAAVDICLMQLARQKYLSYDSPRRGPNRMRETGKGRKASREKKRDSTHAEKMRMFKRIWALYLESAAGE